VRRFRNAALVLCLFILYCVLLSQGLRANALSTFLGASAAVPLTLHLYNRARSELVGTTPQSNGQRYGPRRHGLADSGSGPS
jgi:hypothetical protein